MPAHVNFNQLYYFWIIAKEGSIKKASEKLRLTPPGLSGQLRYLEEFLGKKLFDREIRKLVLNDTGRIAFDYAGNIFKQSEEMVRAIQQPKPKKQTLLRIGVLPSLSKTHIHDFIFPLWKDKYVSVTVVENKLDELIFQLGQGELELILSDRPSFIKSRRFRSFKLKPRKIIAVGSQSFISAKKLFPKSLSGLPLLHLTQHSHLRSEIDDYFEMHNVNPQIIGEADDVALLRLGAERGVGITILPQNTVHQAISSGRLFKLGELKGINSDMWAMVKAKTKCEKILEKTIEKFRSLD
ncbi:MAG: LysR substrate-binding domain-containing protein [bacterium]